MTLRNGMPQIGTKATEFKAINAQGNLKTSSELTNSWIVLFSTPPNSKEFMNFWKKNEEFESLNCILAESFGSNDLANAREISFIDPNGVVRTIIYSSLSLEVNFDDIKRTLLGLQAVDTYGIALPSDWYPGEEVIIHKESPCPVAKQRINDSIKTFLN